MRHFVVVALVVTFLLSMTALSVSASSSGHGCAPHVPPSISGSLAPSVPGMIVINEVLLVPHSTWNCSESPGTYSVIADTWIELYNTQNQPFNLYASHAVIDSGPGTNAAYFPFGASIAAHGYLVLFPRYDASFLMSETSTLRLVIAGVAIDQVTVPQLAPDQSYARTTNGASNWQIINSPTIDNSNSTSQVTPPANGNNGSGTTPGSGNRTSSAPTGNSFNNTKALVDGVQPRWTNLHVPQALTVTPTGTNNTGLSTITTPGIPTSSGSDIPRRIALTALLILVALVILWCWRTYYKRS